MTAFWDPMIEGFPTPYDAIFRFLKMHAFTGTARRMAKFILALYDPANGFSVRECLDGSDSECTRLMVIAVAYYAVKGDDADLRRIGRKVYDMFPDVAALGKAIEDAALAFKRDG